MSGHDVITATTGEAARDDPREPVTAPGSWLREHAWLGDLIVALAVFAYNLPILPVYSSDPVRLGALLAVSVCLCGPYLLRRRHPLAVLGVMLVAASIQLSLGAPIIAADAMLLLAVYNVATRLTWWVSLSGAAATVAWLLVAAVPHLGEDFLRIGQLGLLVVVVGWVWTWGTLVRIRRDYIAGLQEHARQLEREREAQARIAAADERARIAREIHDIVSHSLSVVVVMSDGAAAKVSDDPERARWAMQSVRDTGRSALAEMRRMLGVLRDGEPGSHAPQPGISRLGRLVEESRAAGLPVQTTVEGEPVEMPSSLDVAVYRMVQEALTNVRKHAGSSVTWVDVRLRYGAAALEVQVTDDGQGSHGASQETSGHGLVGMRERVAAFGGTVRAGTRRDGGFQVTIVLPSGGDR